ncbi:MAG: permease prefix domain 1-containing protein [Candidatus Izemoplasmatales bacterium]|jgi:cation transport ATPase|nr:permease prefix domain 1-containing protein [Candidatus Izemoplasmatales bacterium]
MNKIKSFVTRLLKGMFNDQDKRELIEILTRSLEEKVDDLVEAGTPVQEAIKRSINEFGSSDDVLDAFPDKEKLRSKKIKSRFNKLIFALAAYLIVCALVLFVNYLFIDFFANYWWSGIVAIGALFWPLSMFYAYLKAKR